MQILGTQALDMGNQTLTHLRDQKSGREYSVILIWEKVKSSKYAMPFRIQITAGRSTSTNTADIERVMGIETPDVVQPFSSSVLRRIPYEKIIDSSREALLQKNSLLFSVGITVPHALPEQVLKKEKKKGRPFDRPDEFYRNIARLYEEALSLGGSVARKPSVYIATKLSSEVKYFSKNNRSAQIRKWVAEARIRGYLPNISKDKK